MDITKKQDGARTELSVAGRVDTITAPKLDAAIREILPETGTLILDLRNLAYISSAGLRVLLAAQKAMNERGSMIVQNANDTVSEIFDVTGFSDILTIE